MSIMIVVVALVLLVAIGAIFDNGVPRTYRERPCQGSAWRRRFPESEKVAIRRFLDLFATSFALRSKQGLKFGPSDELMAIYRARYPSRGWPDALEFETLEKELEKSYGFSLQEIWHERLTLGQLFERAQEPNKLLHATCEDART